jgi:predicted transcriptional regulator
MLLTILLDGNSMASKIKAPRLGELEIEVLESLWRRDSLTAAEGHAILGKRRGISLNTVQSTLERLYRKDILSRAKEQRAYRYSPKVLREDLLASLFADLAERLGGHGPAATLAAFIDAAERLDASALSELERMIEQRKTQQQGGP